MTSTKLITEQEYHESYIKLRDELDEIVKGYLRGEGIDYLFDEVSRMKREFTKLHALHAKSMKAGVN